MLQVWGSRAHSQPDSWEVFSTLSSETPGMPTSRGFLRKSIPRSKAVTTLRESLCSALASISRKESQSLLARAILTRFDIAHEEENVTFCHSEATSFKIRSHDGLL